MTKAEKIWLCVSILVALMGLATGAISHFYSTKIISSGEAYGFSIGDNRHTTYAKAQRMMNHNKIKAIHTRPEGEHHRPFNQGENPSSNTDKEWVMVVDPDWWNNKITISYKNDLVVEIRRDRYYSEL